MRLPFAQILLATCVCLLVSTSAKDKSRLVALQEKELRSLSNPNVSAIGQRSLSIDPSSWKHAETENFVIHYRQADDAQKVASLAEYVLWFVEQSLGNNADKHTHKSHLFIFADDADWKTFLSSLPEAPQWAASFVEGHDLYLNIHQALQAPEKEPSKRVAALDTPEALLAALNTGTPGKFDSKIVAHETTHAVVARLYPAKHWPIWLNEGLAEYMLDASLASRKKQPIPDHRLYMRQAVIPVQTLVQMRSYPKEHQQIHQFFASSEKLVRFFMCELPKERFPKFADAVLAGSTFEQALLAVYGDKVGSMENFLRKYEAFDR